MKDYPANLGVKYGEQVESPAFIDFLNRDYSFKSITTQISHNVGLISIRFGRNQTRVRCLRSSDSAYAQQRRTLSDSKLWLFFHFIYICSDLLLLMFPSLFSITSISQTHCTLQYLPCPSLFSLQNGSFKYLKNCNS